MYDLVLYVGIITYGKGFLRLTCICIIHYKVYFCVFLVLEFVVILLVIPLIP